MQNLRQRSDSLGVGVLLALAGGFMESYSFLTRGGVFANCQSGNLALTAMNAVQGNYGAALLKFVPVVAFTLGSLFTEWMRGRWRLARVSWRQAVLAIETALIFAAGMIPAGDGNMAATILIATACALQASAFKTLNGNAYATIMCTGNLRSAALNFYEWRAHKSAEAGARMQRYILIVGCFMLGAALGVGCAALWGVRAAWACCVIFAAAYGLLIAEPVSDRSGKIEMQKCAGVPLS